VFLERAAASAEVARFSLATLSVAATNAGDILPDGTQRSGGETFCFPPAFRIPKHPISHALDRQPPFAHSTRRTASATCCRRVPARASVVGLPGYKPVHGRSCLVRRCRSPGVMGPALLERSHRCNITPPASKRRRGSSTRPWSRRLLSWEALDHGDQAGQRLLWLRAAPAKSNDVRPSPSTPTTPISSSRSRSPRKRS
jgi:hypothetical protein